MKKYIIGGILLVIILLGTYIIASQNNVDYSNAGTTQSLTFLHDGIEREYLLYIPNNHTKDMPLVLALHGGFGHNYDMVNHYGFNEKAEEHSFAVCYPQALKGPNRAEGFSIMSTRWNPNFSFLEVDDLGFLTELTFSIQDEYNLSKKAYAFGFSSGGFMCYSLALNAPGIYNAIGVLSSRMSGTDWDNRQLAEPISVLQVMGDVDEGYGLGDLTEKRLEDYDREGSPVIDEVVLYWATVNDCDPVVKENISDTVEKYSYLNGTDNTSVIFYKVAGLSHNWPSAEYLNNPDISTILCEFFELD